MKSPVRRYGFINAKLRARLGSMLDENKITILLQSNTVDELLQQLSDTHYAEIIESYDRSGDLQMLEAKLFEREVRVHQEIIDMLDGRHAELAAALTRKLEVENLKSVLRLWFSNAVKNQNIQYRYGYLYQRTIVSEIDWSQIINAPSYQDVLKALEHTIYFSSAAMYDFDDIVKDGLFYVETALDRLWFSTVRSAAAKLPRMDREILNRVLDNDADLKNIINLVRYGWLYRLPSDTLQTLMFEGGTVTETKEFQTYLDLPADQRNPLLLVKKHFPKLARQLLDAEKESSLPVGHIEKVERYLGLARKKTYAKMLTGNPFTIGTVLAYFFQCERQDRIIRTIVNGLYYGWDSETVGGFVL
ncbi:MAG: V-type ATPase subunit [Spirochaetales bacterium]|nr:V-type ATPase subunit [Spirochaetales bacterium]